ncbi:MAG: uroporphyrinogen decarboxylase [Alphaproteobacteria bacterium]|nr:uroporphyrinogen decarboxylase [Alphaproteobacteria bacterium]
MSSRLIGVLSGKNFVPPPLWMMRQAGRYLPEYQETRKKAGSFWTMCQTPELAAEVTLQPVRRFGFDAAILFSDILTVPAALGLKVAFDDGPKLPTITSTQGLERAHEAWAAALAPAYETLRLVRPALGADTALLGFAGAPWTLATYMAAGGGGDEQKAAKLWAYRDPAGFAKLIDVLVDAVSRHLVGQLQAGADAVQIFDSWASGLTPQGFKDWVVRPTARVVAAVRAVLPEAKIIGFPRGATLAGLERYARETGVDAVSLDTAVPVGWAAEKLGDDVALQGNLDPLALLAGGDALARGVAAILEAGRNSRLVFNLGHGILPETPIAHVEQLIALVRGSS